MASSNSKKSTLKKKKVNDETVTSSSSSSALSGLSLSSTPNSSSEKNDDKKVPASSRSPASSLSSDSPSPSVPQREGKGEKQTESDSDVSLIDPSFAQQWGLQFATTQLSRINEIRAEHKHEPWPVNKDNLSWAAQCSDITPTESFTKEEFDKLADQEALRNSNRSSSSSSGMKRPSSSSPARSDSSKSRRTSRSRSRDRRHSHSRRHSRSPRRHRSPRRSKSPRTSSKKNSKSKKHNSSDDDSDNDQLQDQDGNGIKNPDDHDDVDHDAVDGANTQLKPEIKALIPPSWNGPDRPIPKETTTEKERREKSALLWEPITLLDDTSRRKLMKENAFSINKKGEASRAGATMPPATDITKHLEVLNKSKDKSIQSYCRVLSKDIPHMINRTSDVLRVVLTALNNWELLDKDDIHEVMKSCMLPLLVDNNIKATELMVRTSFKAAHPDSKLPDQLATTIPASQHPLIRGFVATETQDREVEKATQKALGPSSSSSSSSSSFSNRGRGSTRGRGRSSGVYSRNRAPPRSTYTPRSNNNSISSNNNHRSSLNNGSFNKRGGGRPSSSSSSKDKPST